MVSAFKAAAANLTVPLTALDCATRSVAAFTMAVTTDWSRVLAVELSLLVLSELANAVATSL